MAYLGNAPARSFISFERQVFTIVNSQTVYTLSHSVTNENDIRLVVNNVVQEPGSGKAYTASGTTLTLSAALTNGTDEMYCVFLGRAVGTVDPPAGSVDTAQLASEAVTDAKVASSIITGQTAETSIATDDLILLSDTSASGALKKMTRANFVSGIGGTNTPAFQAYMSSNQVLSNDIETLLQFNTEDFDTAGAYDHSTNYRFTPQTAGKYFVYAMVLTSGDANSTLLGGGLFVRKNGSKVLESRSNPKNNNGRAFTNSISIILDLNGSSDYVDMFGVVDQSGGTPTIEAGTRFSRFGAYKIIE